MKAHSDKATSDTSDVGVSGGHTQSGAHSGP